MQVSIIIPTRNEEANITPLMQGITSSMVGIEYEVLIVDDSDSDATILLASANGAKVLVGRHLGLAQAVLDGIDASDGEYIIVMDADLQHPPALLPDIVKKLKRFDLVVVTKHNKKAESQLSPSRKLQSNLGVWLSQILIPAPVSDPMTGFFGIRRKCLDGVPRGEYYQVDEKKAIKLEKIKPRNWSALNIQQQGKWYWGKGVATKLIGIEAIGFKIGLELFTKAKWVAHTEIPMSFAKREFGLSKGTRHSLQKHLWRLFNNSLAYEVELPKGSEEYFYFYEGMDWQKEWKQSIALVLQDVTRKLGARELLDCGGGSSPNINYMYGEKTGMDIRPEAVEFMKQHSDAQFVVGSVLDIPFLKSTFGVVTCIEVLEHLYPNQVEQALSEIVRVLQPDGIVILAIPNYSSPLWNMIENAQKILQPGRWTSDHHTKLNRQSLSQLCSKYGLVEIRYDGVMSNMDMVITYQKAVKIC